MDLPDISTPPAMPPRDDDLFATLRLQVPGYRLVGILGRGGQAAVYKAIDVSTGSVVAVKILHGGPLAHLDARHRFAREVLALKALSHPNIVPCLLNSETPDGHAFIVMPFIEGCRLDEFLWPPKDSPAPDLATRLGLFLKICDAVGAAHRAGITHRDISPSNIRVDHSGEPHILDFGLARTAFDDLLAPDRPPVTLTHQFLGKVAYASPEQIRGQRDAIDIRSDVYSLGVILYQILADGRFPYDVTGSMVEVLDNILKKAPQKLSDPPADSRQDSLQAAAGQVALHALQKNPADRPGSANELAHELEQCLRSRAGRARATRPVRALALAGGAVLVAVVLVVAWFHFHARAQAVNSSASIDLLRLLDIARDNRGPGAWNSRDGKVTSAGASGNQLEFAYACPPEYDLHVDLIPPRGASHLMFFVPAGAHQINWDVGSRGNTACGIDLINDKDEAQNVTTRWAKQWLVPDQVNSVVIQIRRHHFAGYLNGALVCDYDTDFQNIGLREWTHFSRPDTPGVMFYVPGVQITAATLTEISGQGHSLGAQASPATAKMPVTAAPRNFSNGLGMAFVRIEAGNFIMGTPSTEPDHRSSESPQHKVIISKPFYMQATPVTRGQFAQFADETHFQTDAERAGGIVTPDRKGGWKTDLKGSWRNPGFDQEDDHPVVCVSWNDAMAFINWLNKKEGKKYRLPTEAEWEYCCRAGTQTVYFWGDKPEDGSGFANVYDFSMEVLRLSSASFKFDDGYVFTSPVRAMKPNPWGLYDMIGNAGQYCQDFSGAYPSGDVVDPVNLDSHGGLNPAHIYRNGGWYGSARGSRSGARAEIAANNGTAAGRGFRVVLDIPS